MSLDQSYLPSLAATETIKIGRSEIAIHCSTMTNTGHPVYMNSGPMMIALSVDESLALANALICMAHHYTAAMAEYNAAQAVQS